MEREVKQIIIDTTPSKRLFLPLN